MRDMVVDLRSVARQSAEVPLVTPRVSRFNRAQAATITLTVIVIVIAASGLIVSRFRQLAEPERVDYTQLTNFADSAVSPALSPDGRMLTFIRGDTAFFPYGQIYVKLLPDGEPKQLTNDGFRKFSPKFSPDGARIAYSTGSTTLPTMDTWIVSVIGGQPRRLLTNAEGLTWFEDAFRPSVSPDARKLYYLVRIFGERTWISGGLWVADLESGTRERLLPDFRILHYSISADGQRIVFVAVDRGRSPLWIAPLNGRTAPRRLGTLDGTFVYFGAPGEVVFGSQKQQTGSQEEPPAIYRIKEDGSGLQKLIPTPFLLPFSVSPDGPWVPVMDPSAWSALMVYPAGGGAPTRVCDGCSPPQGTDPMPPPLSWSPDGRFAYLKFATSTYAIPLKTGQMLPLVPPSGFPSKDTVAALPGARLLSDDGDNVYPGPNLSVYAFVKKTTQRNIYRVPVPWR